MLRPAFPNKRPGTSSLLAILSLNGNFYFLNFFLKPVHFIMPRPGVEIGVAVWSLEGPVGQDANPVHVTFNLHFFQLDGDFYRFDEAVRCRLGPISPQLHPSSNVLQFLEVLFVAIQIGRVALHLDVLDADVDAEEQHSGGECTDSRGLAEEE